MRISGRHFGGAGRGDPFGERHLISLTALVDLPMEEGKGRGGARGVGNGGARKARWKTRASSREGRSHDRERGKWVRQVCTCV